MRKAFLQPLLLSACLGLFGAGSAMAQQAEPDAGSVSTQQAESSQGDHLRSAFEELDADKDGKLSEQEVSTVDFLSKNFSRVDSDGDGSISLEEFRAAPHPTAPQ